MHVAAMSPDRREILYDIIFPVVTISFFHFVVPRDAI